MNRDMSGMYVARAAAPRPTPDDDVKAVQRWEFAFTWTDEGSPDAFPADRRINHMQWNKCSANQNMNFTLMWKNIATCHKDFETPDGKIQEYKYYSWVDQSGLVQADGTLRPVPVLFQTRGYAKCKYLLQEALFLVFFLCFFWLVWRLEL